LLGPKDASLTKATLWHPDLHIENIFVDPTTQPPTHIVTIIDWQAVNIASLSPSLSPFPD
jgi:hypothetical protein